jgi:hypothetical protein
MKRRTIGLLCLVVTMSVAYVVLLSMLRPTPRHHPSPHLLRARRAEGAPPPGPPLRAVPKPRVTVTVMPLSLEARQISRDADAGMHGELDGIPRIDELDAIHPGLASAVRQGRGAAKRQRMRDMRECSLLLPDETMALNWDTVETYIIGDDGDAVVDTVDIYPASGDHEEFYACLAAASVGNTHVAAPSGAHGNFQLRDGGRFILDADLTAEDVTDAVANLRRRLDEPQLSESERGVLADHLALWECYATRGLAFRRECREQAVYANAPSPR